MAIDRGGRNGFPPAETAAVNTVPVQFEDGATKRLGRMLLRQWSFKDRRQGTSGPATSDPGTIGFAQEGPA